VAVVGRKPVTVVDKKTNKALTEVNWPENEEVLFKQVTKQISEICSTLTKYVKLC